MKKLLLALIVTIFITGCQHSATEPPIVQVGDQKFIVEIADEGHERREGLMYREELDEGHGMLFIFPKESPHSFWMKNTLIPLDIIWLSEKKEIVDIQTVPPCKPDTNCQSYKPKVAAKYVLEVNAGEFKGKVGDEATFEIEIEK